VQRWQPTYHLGGHITGRADEAQHVRWQIQQWKHLHVYMCIGEACGNQQHSLLHTSPVSTLVQIAGVMHPNWGLTPEERVAVLPSAPLRLGLPMVREPVRSMASGWFDFRLSAR
jgi:hypothetical protein